MLLEKSRSLLDDQTLADSCSLSHTSPFPLSTPGSLLQGVGEGSSDVLATKPLSAILADWYHIFRLNNPSMSFNIINEYWVLQQDVWGERNETSSRLGSTIFCINYARKTRSLRDLPKGMSVYLYTSAFFNFKSHLLQKPSAC